MLALMACHCSNVRGCRTIALGHDICRVIQDSAVLYECFNPLNPELNPIFHLLVLLGAHPFLHISRIRVNEVILGKEVPINMGPVQTFEGILAGT